MRIGAMLLVSSLCAQAQAGAILGRVTPAGVVYVEAGSATPKTLRLAVGPRTLGPPLSVVPAGSSVEVVNEDSAAHEITVAGKSLGLLSPGERRLAPLGRVRDVAIRCRTHAHAPARVLIVPSDLWTVTAKDGNYTLTGVPAGTHGVVAWAPGHERARQRVRVSAEGSVPASFVLTLVARAGAGSLSGTLDDVVRSSRGGATGSLGGVGIGTSRGVAGIGTRGSGRGGGGAAAPGATGGGVVLHPKRSTVDFGDAPIEGNLAKPDGVYLESRKASRPAEPTPPMTAPALRAGRHDDNKQYNRFVQFLAENARLVVYPIDVSERLVVRTLDEDGKSLYGCSVEVLDTAGKALSTTRSYADGSTQFFPAAAPASEDYVVQARCGDTTRHGQLARHGARSTEVRFPFARELPESVPVDIALVVDTTGSMQSQIGRLRDTLRAIHFQLTSLPARPDIRFALVAYRDRGDEYVTLVHDFTPDAQAFAALLTGLEADGGGDTPEDLQAALDDAMHRLTWRDDALRLGFVVADAPPHTDYGQGYTYRDAMRDSLRRAIKWTMIGAGGLARNGEVIFRQIAQHSMGEYVFVTDGPAGDHEGGAGEASRHVGSNYRVENLDQAIVRIVRRELSYLTDEPRDFEDTIVARADAPRDEVLAPAVAEVLRQLSDYSSLRLGGATPVAVIPVAAPDAADAGVTGYLTDKLVLATSRHPSFRVLERDMALLAQELSLQLSDLADAEQSVPFGKMLGADVLIVSKLTVHASGATLFAKLVRVETGEVLSVAQVDIGPALLTRS